MPLDSDERRGEATSLDGTESHESGAVVGGRDLDELWTGVATFDRVNAGVCITDAVLDSPGPVIEYVNDGYLDIFCCDRDEVIGRDPRIGQGPLTDRATLDRIREHLGEARSVRAQAINYRIDRTPFRLRWSIDPLCRHDELLGFVAILGDVTVEDRVRRRLSALDMLMSHGRRATELPENERIGAVVDALGESLAPLFEELGEAAVEWSGGIVRTPSHCSAAERTGTIEVAVGSSARVLMAVHPDAVKLLDRVAIDELCGHATWLLDIAARH